MNVLKDAIKYLELGWSVIPVHPDRKIPSRPWKEFQDRRMTLTEAVTMFSGDANIGLVCGDVSGILVVDHDLYKNKTQTEFVFNTPLWATTPRGGKHYYFRYKEGNNTVNEQLAIDIRSKGGYVLLPPSEVFYEDTKQRGTYSWNIEPSKELLMALPEAPESLLMQLYARDKGFPGVAPSAPPGGVFDPTVGFGMAEGGRNNFLSMFSLSTLNRMNGNLEMSWQLVRNFNATFKPPLSDAEVKATFESAVRKYRESPPQSTRMATRIPQGLPEVKPAGDPNFVDTTFEQDLELATKVFLEGRVKGESTGFPELDDVIGGYIPGQSYLIYADTSVGKSVFALTTLMKLAERGVRSVYFDLENSMELTVERMAFIAQAGELSLRQWREMGDRSDKDAIVGVLAPLAKLNISVWDLNKLTDKFGDINWAGAHKVIEEEVQKGARFVVIDHLHYFSPSETDHAYLGEVMRQINNLCAIHGISILVVAHTKKGLTVTDKEGRVRSLKPSIDYISGSGMISRHSKNVISLYRNVMAETAEERASTTVRVDKTKFGPVGSFELIFHEQHLYFSQDPEGNRAQKNAKELFEAMGTYKEAEVLAKKTPEDPAVAPPPEPVAPEVPFLDRVTPSMAEKEEPDFWAGEDEEEGEDDTEMVDGDIESLVDDILSQGGWESKINK